MAAPIMNYELFDAAKVRKYGNIIQISCVIQNIYLILHH